MPVLFSNDSFEILDSDNEDSPSDNISNSANSQCTNGCIIQHIQEENTDSKFSRTLKCLYTNAQSIVNKHFELQALVDTYDPDIIGLTETWLNGKISDKEFCIDGYHKPVRQDRLDTKDGRGGGVLMLVKNSVNFVQIFPHNSNDYTNSIWIEVVNNNGKKTVIGVVYRSPNSPITNNERLENCIHELSHRDLVIMGDFNYPDIDWSNLSAGCDGYKFLNIVMDNFLHQHVHFPTRENNILDLLLTSDPNVVNSIECIGKLGSSDHIHLLTELNLTSDIVENSEEIPDWKRANREGLREYLDIDWKSKFERKDTHQCWEEFKTLLQDSIVHNVPMKKRRVKSEKKVWMTREIVRQIRKKKHLYRKYRLTREPQTFNRYKEVEAHVKQLIRDSVYHFEQRLGENIKQDSKSFYKYVKSKQQVKDNIGPLKGRNGETSSDSKFMADELNSFFASSFTRENSDNIKNPNITFSGNDSDQLKDIIITPEVVKKHLNCLKRNKSPGPDKLGSSFLLDMCDLIVEPLSTIFNISLKLRQVPNDWKEANVTPIFKKGDKSDPGNYRPISLTSQVCKVFESIIRENIVNHLNTHSLLLQSQHGFTKGKSCLTNLLLFLEDVTKAIDQGNPLDVIYLDFSKAFDKVPHQRLLCKIEHHGISGNVAAWIREWLRDRRQRVVLNGERSGLQHVLSGVPQGSVLGPTLFLIFVNDIDTVIASNIQKFADDCKVYRSVPTDTEISILQKDINNLCQWSKDWQMVFNVKKCKSLHIGHYNTHYVYSMNEEELQSVSEETDLGVAISNDLKPSKQCVSAVKKANMTLGMIKRHIVSRDKNTIIRLYKGLVRPKLEYCIQAWNPSLIKDIELLEQIQHRATKLIPEISHLPYHERLKHLNLTTLELRRHRGDLIETFKILKGKEGIPVDGLFSLNTYVTRGNSLKLDKPRSRLNLRQNFFSQRVVNAWNRLPEKVISCDTVNGFKNTIDRYLKELHGVSMTRSLNP